MSVFLGTFFVNRNRGRLSGASRISLPLLAVAVLAAGCSGVPPSNVRTNARLTPTTGVTRDLVLLPRPKARVPIAVYGVRDQTGQYKASPDSSYSTLVTQGATSILVKSLEDSGWYVPVEREGLQNLLTERRIIRAIETPGDKGKPAINLPNLMPASLIVEGGVIAYESNVRTGGKGANYLGIGASNQYRVDQVTVSLRDIDVRGGQVLNTVSVTKTIYSYQFSANIYKYTSYQHILQAETGFTTNEPAQLAVREAIEAAVIHLTVLGIRDRYLELRDEREWTSPVIQSYLAEGLANLGEDTALDDGPIPMRPLTADREGAAVATVAALGDDFSRSKPAAPEKRPEKAPEKATEKAPDRGADKAPEKASGNGPVGPTTKAPDDPLQVQVERAPPLPPPLPALAVQPSPGPVRPPASPPVPVAAPAPAAPATEPPASPTAAQDDIFKQYWKSR